jgi:hypothetical protein
MQKQGQRITSPFNQINMGRTPFSSDWKNKMWAPHNMTEQNRTGQDRTDMKPTFPAGVQMPHGRIKVAWSSFPLFYLQHCNETSVRAQ